jgi:type III secretion protein R
MLDGNINLVSVFIVLFLVAFIPLAVVTMTGFLKLSVVLFIVRNALGIQQSPPNFVLYTIALILAIYISSPLLNTAITRLNSQRVDTSSIESLTAAANRVKEPIREHLVRFTYPVERQFFMAATARIWPESARADVKDDDLLILLPSFVSSELTRAFEIGFLLYLPFLVVDVVVSNILMAMGMIMVSPTLISIPLKLFLFVTVDGWSRLLHGLILSYAL